MLGNVDTERCRDLFQQRTVTMVERGRRALPGVTPRALEDHFQNSDDLRLAGTSADISKHHTRTRGPTARIEETITSSAGSRVNIRVDVADPAPVRSTADLAERCMENWRAFKTLRDRAAA